uniref:EF-hand domain-containing protein n=1 Tax=Phaeomonas parva TaxID=124430 RepID=A0A6U4DCT4_9STRA
MSEYSIGSYGSERSAAPRGRHGNRRSNGHSDGSYRGGGGGGREYGSERGGSHRGGSRRGGGGGREAWTEDARGAAADALVSERIVDRVREAILARGGSNGIRSVARLLKVMDDDGNGKLSKTELKYGLKDMGITVSDQNLVTLMRYFDRDGDGNISFDEFLTGLRGDMSERRQGLVHMAYDKLDVTGDGIVTIDDIREAYDVSQHPGVLDGSKTPDEVLAEFLDQFDRHKKDGIVDVKEFMDYYRDISASVDDDDYFELMMRNAWHISGGEGWCENTTNKRVLVTHRDGRQTVEEIKDDLGVRPDDVDGYRERLRRQNIDAADMELYGGVDTTKGRKSRGGRPPARGSGRSNPNPKPKARGSDPRPAEAKPKRRSSTPWATEEPSPKPRAKPTRSRAPWEADDGGDDDDSFFDEIKEDKARPAPGPGGGPRANPRAGSRANPSSDRPAGQRQAPRRRGGGSRATQSQLAETAEDPIKMFELLFYTPPCPFEELLDKLSASQIDLDPSISPSTLERMLSAADRSMSSMVAKQLAINIARALGVSAGAPLRIRDLYDALSQRFGRDSKSKRPTNIVERVRAKIIDRCGPQVGIKGVQRALKVMDDSGDGKLSKEEIKYGLQDYGIELNISELDQIMTYFDKDGDGTVSFDEFLVGLRGDMNERRQEFVRMAYAKLDSTGDGIVTIDDIRHTYDVSQHPGVVDGTVTPDEALATFLEQFDTQEKDGIVTIEEFMDYYKNVSASIDGDDHFELMMRNAWHISGGEGWCANTSNKRVLVTHRDGRQTVEEVKNDLGVRPGDVDGYRQRLRVTLTLTLTLSRSLSPNPGP